MAEKQLVASLPQSGEQNENVVTSQRFSLLQEELALRSRMQTAVSELGQASLTFVDASLLTAQACALVADTLSVELCRVLEYVPESDQLVTRAMVGASLSSDWSGRVDSEALYAFHCEEPVVFQNLESETRFDGKPLLSSRGVVSGVSVRLRGRFEPFGTLGAYTTTPRQFREFEVEFVQSIASVLAAAIERKRTSEELAETKAQIAHRERIGAIGSWSWSRGQRDWRWSDEVYRILGAEPEEITPDYASFLKRVHVEDRKAVGTMIERAFAINEEQVLEHRVLRSDGSSRFVRTVAQGVFTSEGKPLRLIGTTQDITDVTVNVREAIRLGAMIELAAQEWRMTCDALEVMLLVVDTGGAVLRLNERARQMLGISYDAAVGGRLPEAVAGEPWRTLRDLVTVVSETHLASKALAVDETAGTQWQISARSLRHEVLGDERIVVVINDISDASEHEKVRRDADVLESIMHLVSALSERASAPLETLGDLLSRSAAALQLSSTEAKAARAAAYDLGRLFRNLDEYAQPFTMSLEPMKLETVIKETIGHIAPVALARGVEIEAELCEVPQILGSLSRLDQLFFSTLRLFIDRCDVRDVVKIEVARSAFEGRDWVNVMIEAPRAIFTNAEVRWVSDPRLPRIDDDTAARLSINHRIVEEHGAHMLLANGEMARAIASFRFPAFNG